MKAHALSRRSFDWIMASLGFLFAAGAILDGWAHNHLAKLEGFFTPWHAVFYGGFALLLVFVLMYALSQRQTGLPWHDALPEGYAWTAFGLATFVISAFCDMLWHIRFGVEADTSTLFSPPHLGIATSMVLITSGPLLTAAAAARKARSDTWPAMIALTSAFSVIMVFSQYATPLTPIGTGQPFFFLRNTLESLGALVMLWSTGLFMGAIFFALQRLQWCIPLGGLTFFFTINALLMALQTDAYRLVPAVALTGLIADLFVHYLRPSAVRRGALCAFAFAVPMVYWFLHDITLTFTGLKFYYPAPMLSGTVVACGIVGLLLTTLIRAEDRLQGTVQALDLQTCDPPGKNAGFPYQTGLHGPEISRPQ